MLFKRKNQTTEPSYTIFVFRVFIGSMVLGVAGGFFIDFGFTEGGKAIETVAVLLFSFGCLGAASISEESRKNKKDQGDG
jgi:hypothetical protein